MKARKLLVGTALALALGLIAARPAQAAPFVIAFPSAASTVVGSIGFIDSDEIGFFWSATRGDSVEQTFAGTGLGSIDSLDLSLEVTQNVLSPGQFVNWEVSVNGTAVGLWGWSSVDGIGAFVRNFDFAPIFGGGTYTIRMEVLNTVPGGGGSIALRYPGEAVLDAQVPEPATLSLLLGGGAMALLRRRRRQ